MLQNSNIPEFTDHFGAFLQDDKYYKSRKLGLFNKLVGVINCIS